VLVCEASQAPISTREPLLLARPSPHLIAAGWQGRLLGLGVQGQAELGLGGQGVLGKVPDLSSFALLNINNFRHAPQSPPLEIIHQTYKL